MMYFLCQVEDFNVFHTHIHFCVLLYVYFIFIFTDLFCSLCHFFFVCALLSPGHSVRFADMPGKSRKKKKNMKELTPLQAMMLRMAGG